MRQPSLKELAARVTHKRSPVLAVDRKRAIVAARDAAGLEEWRAPLILGRLHICGNCRHNAFGADPASLGHCSQFATETAPFVPFECPGFEVNSRPTAPEYLPDPDRARDLVTG